MGSEQPEGGAGNPRAGGQGDSGEGESWVVVTRHVEAFSTYERRTSPMSRSEAVDVVQAIKADTTAGDGIQSIWIERVGGES